MMDLETHGAARVYRAIQLLLAACFATALTAQTPPRMAFDVASVKPSVSGAPSTSDIQPGRFHCTNKSVAWLMWIAYSIEDNQLSNAPDWVRSAGFDIEARTQAASAAEMESHLGPLLQSLLEDRFHLKVHREDRQTTLYSLVVAKNGPKMKRSDTPNPSMGNSLQDGKMVLKAEGLSMGGLARFLSRQAGRPVADKTGLSGNYDVKLEWSPDQNPDSAADSIFSAIQEQLGLRIEATKGPVSFVVIDSVERPSEN
ncbi:MAG TPA: TIGR03435 family protein [Bryobacteraceae bacterium]|nr:TIGR03435 family protein [Bryobacteraceae bacterium]